MKLKELETSLEKHRTICYKKDGNSITYHNKDVLSKVMAENFKDKSLKVYGIDVPKIKEVLPTNLPEI